MSSKALKKGLTAPLNPAGIKSVNDLKTNLTNPMQGLKNTVNGFKQSAVDILDPADLQGRGQAAEDAKIEEANKTTQDAELAAIRSRMLPNSPLNTFRPFVDPSMMAPMQRPQMPQAGQQFDPQMLRAMIQTPQFGKMANEQWMQQRQQAQRPSGPQKMLMSQQLRGGLLQG